jgi:hypothetical protein
MPDRFSNELHLPHTKAFAIVSKRKRRPLVYISVIGKHRLSLNASERISASAQIRRRNSLQEGCFCFGHVAQVRFARVTPTRSTTIENAPKSNRVEGMESIPKCFLGGGEKSRRLRVAEIHGELPSQGPLTETPMSRTFRMSIPGKVTHKMVVTSLCLVAHGRLRRPRRANPTQLSATHLLLVTASVPTPTPSQPSPIQYLFSNKAVPRPRPRSLRAAAEKTVARPRCCHLSTEIAASVPAHGGEGTNVPRLSERARPTLVDTTC